MNEFDAAVARGEARATAEIAAYFDPTVASVSTKNGPDVEYYKLCLLCHWPRQSDKCNCKVDQDA